MLGEGQDVLVPQAPCRRAYVAMVFTKRSSEGSTATDVGVTLLFSCWGTATPASELLRLPILWQWKNCGGNVGRGVSKAHAVVLSRS